jgi:hypothetical protein
MCRVSQQQVWLAVGHQLMPLELSFDSVVQTPAVCTIDADLCITDLAQAQVEVGGKSTSYVCTVDTGGWLRVWDLIGARELLAVQVAAEGSALQAVLSVGGRRRCGFGGLAGLPAGGEWIDPGIKWRYSSGCGGSVGWSWSVFGWCAHTIWSI